MDSADTFQGGKPGWAWIFILEGLLTVVIGIISFWMVHDFPDDATFLSEVDRARLLRRLKLDQQSSAEHEEFKMKYVTSSVKEWKMWLSMFIYAGADMVCGNLIPGMMNNANIDSSHYMRLVIFRVLRFKHFSNLLQASFCRVSSLAYSPKALWFILSSCQSHRMR